MIIRSRHITDSWLRFEAEGAKHAVIFLHGLKGSNGQDYWGKLPALLCNDRSFSSVDFAWWQYPTHRWPSPRILEIARWHRKLPNIPDIAKSLITDLRAIVIEKRYESIALAGHSMGGIILFELIQTLKSPTPFGVNTRIGGLALLSSPFWRSRLALAVSIVQLGTNCQLVYLAHKGRLSRSLKAGIEVCKGLNISTWYVGTMEDEVVQYKPIYDTFDKSEMIGGAHLWMPEINSIGDSKFTALTRFVQAGTGLRLSGQVGSSQS